jgi:hypothetical protein
MRRVHIILAAAIALAAMLFVAAAPAQATTSTQSGETVTKVSTPPSAGQLVTPASAYGCPDNYSCYYDGHYGTYKIWTAPSCGFFDLGRFSPPLNDRISSIVNLGHGSIQAYNWVGYWQAVGGRVPVGYEADYWGSWDNIIDAVSIAC